MTRELIYLTEDSRNLFKIFAEHKFSKVDLILTSPPYFDVKSYDKIESQIGYKQHYTDYLNDTADILQQCYQVSNEDATLWVIADTIQRNGILLPIPFDLNQKLIELSATSVPKQQTWILRDIIVWNRSKNLPWHTRGRLKHEFEYILFFSKNDKYKYHIDRIRIVSEYQKWWLTYPERYHPEGRPPSNIWEFAIPTRGWGNSYQNHLCPFPFPLIERILNLSSDENDVILDPFAGSGSVIALAQQMGRQGIAIDISKNYKEKFHSEVVVGAKKYWEERQKELEQIDEKNRQFKEINTKLRKIKTGIRLTKQIRNQLKDNKCVYVILDNQEIPNGIELVVLMDEDNNLKLSDMSVFLNDLKNTFNINALISFKDSELAMKQFKESSLFTYLSNRIYSYSKSLPFPDIVKDSRRFEYVFSNIEVNVTTNVVE